MAAYLGMLSQTYQEFREDRAQEFGAAVAYFAIFSVAPLLLVAIAIAGLFFDPQTVQGYIEKEAADVFGPGAAAMLGDVIEAARADGGSWIALLAGIGAVLLGATGVMVHLKRAMNHIWDVPRPPGGWRRALRERTMALGMVLVIGFLLLVSLLVTAVLAALSDWLDGLVPGGHLMLRLLGAVVSFAVIALLFATLFKVLPDVTVQWRDVWVGAAVTALLFTIGKEAIGLYLGNSGVASAYGAAGSLVVILVWVYFSALIFFMGAEFTQVHAKQNGRAIRPQRIGARGTAAED